MEQNSHIITFIGETNERMRINDYNTHSFNSRLYL